MYNRNRRGATCDARKTVASTTFTAANAKTTAVVVRLHSPSRSGLLVPFRHRASGVAPLRFFVQMSFLRQLLVLSARLHYLFIR